MFGCLRRAGCLALLLVCAGAAFLTRHRWLPHVIPGSARDVASLPWDTVSADGAARARRAIARLSQPSGPVFANMPAGDFASFVLDSVSRASGSARPVEAAVDGDRFLLRVPVRVADLGVENVPFLGGVADKTATVMVGGTLSVGRPGHAEWRIQTIRVDAIQVPGPMLSRVTRALARRLDRAGTRSDAIEFALPSAVADLRVKESVITLYKAAR